MGCYSIAYFSTTLLNNVNVLFEHVLTFCEGILSKAHFPFNKYFITITYY